jgi:hypothetical protein
MRACGRQGAYHSHTQTFGSTVCNHHGHRPRRLALQQASALRMDSLAGGSEAHGSIRRQLGNTEVSITNYNRFAGGVVAAVVSLAVTGSSTAVWPQQQFTRCIRPLHWSISSLLRQVQIALDAATFDGSLLHAEGAEQSACLLSFQEGSRHRVLVRSSMLPPRLHAHDDDIHHK